MKVEYGWTEAELAGHGAVVAVRVVESEDVAGCVRRNCAGEVDEFAGAAGEVERVDAVVDGVAGNDNPGGLGDVATDGVAARDVDVGVGVGVVAEDWAGKSGDGVEERDRRKWVKAAVKRV